MECVDIYKKIISLSKINWSLLSSENHTKIDLEFKELIELFEKNVTKSKESNTLSQILDIEEREDVLPIPSMFVIFKQLILIEQKKEYLDFFSRYLLRYGPDWEDEANNIKTEINNGNINKAAEIALSISYDKYN